ncbi:MAG: aminoacyl-tRNA hydrolase [Rikenellaceae bacterium]
MKYLVVGLGNIGAEYRETRHNIGFKVLDALAESAGATFSTARYGDIAEIKHKGRSITLLKPSTYMNLSGKAVRYWMEALKLSVESVLVVSDDIALPFGTIRVRAKGSHGGHNGHRNIIELVGTDKYPRIKFGVGSSFAVGQQIDYVLGEWDEEERAALAERTEMVGKAILSFSTAGLSNTMNTFNNK